MGNEKTVEAGIVVEIGANRQSGDPSATLLLKLVLEVVIEVAGCFHVKDYSEHEYSSPGRD
jgi:hypothetical protein